MLHDAREASRALPSVTMPDAAWTKVDDTWLPSGWQQRGDLVVERYPDGQLSRLVRLVGDVASYELTLAHGQPRGRVTDHQGSGGSADYTTHVDGFSESFDAWSDNSRPWPEPFATFARRAIARVAGGG